MNTTTCCRGTTSATADFESRVERITRLLEDDDEVVLMMTSPESVRYLIGAETAETVVVTAGKLLRGQPADDFLQQFNGSVLVEREHVTLDVVDTFKFRKTNLAPDSATQFIRSVRRTKSPHEITQLGIAAQTLHDAMNAVIVNWPSSTAQHFRLNAKVKRDLRDQVEARGAALANYRFGQLGSDIVVSAAVQSNGYYATATYDLRRGAYTMTQLVRHVQEHMRQCVPGTPLGTALLHMQETLPQNLRPEVSRLTAAGIGLELNELPQPNNNQHETLIAGDTFQIYVEAPGARPRWPVAAFAVTSCGTESITPLR